MSRSKKPDPRALLKAIEDQAADDDLDEVLAMSDDALDAFIAENGGDSKAIRASGEALVRELDAQAARNAWHGDMRKKVAGARAKAAKPLAYDALSRADLLQRIEAARGDARFAAPVTALFRKKSPEASTDDELRALLAQIELLAGIASDDDDDNRKQ